MSNQIKLKRFKLDYKGVGQVMKSGGMVKVLESHAKNIANRAGDGYSAYVGRNRANVSVRTKTDEAAKDNLKNNTLLKAIK